MAEFYARVVFDPLVAGLDRPLDYLVPPELQGRINPGQRVRVPLGTRSAEGLVVELLETPDLPPGARVRPLSGPVDSEPILGPALLKLARWLSERYLCTLGEALRAMIPPGLRRSVQRRVGLSPDFASEDREGQVLASMGRSEAEKELLSALAELAAAGRSRAGQVDIRRLYRQAAGSVPTIERRRAYDSALNSLVRRGVCLLESEFRDGGRSRQAAVWTAVFPETAEESAASLEAGSPRQAAVLRALTFVGLTAAEIKRRCGADSASLRALEKKGLIRRTAERIWRDPFSGRNFSYPAFVPTPQQKTVVEQMVAAMRRPYPGTILVHGVTGSGKTEVYLQSIEECLTLGRQALVLVPEIALTPQMICRFRGRFGDRVAVLHSRLGAGERYDEWSRVAAGDADIAVGARSALFAPFKHLGLIILDEEHENTYKQEDAPRYHAREAAEFLAHEHRALLVLGSATPSLESYFQALNGEIGLLRLPERIGGRPMPRIEVVDMRTELAEGRRGVISRPLAMALKECLSSGRQAILFLNRRGYSTFVLCRDCGHSMRCPDCEVSLTLHQGQSLLSCHYCGHGESIPMTCPVCSGNRIRHFGAGTEKLEEELSRMFPEARVGRMDVDTTRTRGAHEAILERLESGQTDVLIGTQMVTKGLDFPGVTLVGVVAADIALNLPDFRAAERTFQLITQVSGRSGRGDDPGNVLVQTYNPDHYAVALACRNDYEGFYQKEITVRRELGFPPDSSLVSLVVWGSDQERVKAETIRLARLLTDRDPAQVLGPVPAPLPRLRGNWRWQILVRGRDINELVRRVKKALADRGSSSAASVTVDVNPQSLL